MRRACIPGTNILLAQQHLKCIPSLSASTYRSCFFLNLPSSLIEWKPLQPEKVRACS